MLKPNQAGWADWPKVYDGFMNYWQGGCVNGRPLAQITVAKKEANNPPWYSWWTIVHHLDDLKTPVDDFASFCETHRFYGEAFPSMFINFGAGSMAAYVGATPQIQDETVWFETPMEWDRIFDTLTFNPDNLWWKRTKAITQAALEGLSGKAIVSMTDLGGALDILASLRGTEQLLMDLMIEPDTVKKASSQITKLWHIYFDELSTIIAKKQYGTGAWMGLWAPNRWYPLQCDFSAMISPAMFEEFVLPDITEQCDRIDHAIYHWDGPNQIQHLDMLLSIPNLDGIQWVPGDGKPQGGDPQWWPLYKKIQKSGKRLILSDRAEKLAKLNGVLSPDGLLLQAGADTEEDAARFLDSIKNWKRP
jgi:hypothetical protein